MVETSSLATSRILRAFAPRLRPGGRLLVVATASPRPWFEDMRDAQTPEQAARWPLEPVLADTFEPAFYGELVQFGRVLPRTG